MSGIENPGMEEVQSDEYSRNNEARGEIPRNNEARGEIPRNNEARGEIPRNNEARDEILRNIEALTEDAGSTRSVNLSVNGQNTTLHYPIGIEYN